MKFKKTFIILTIFLILGILLFIFKDQLLTIIYPRTYNEVIKQYADKYKVDDDLVFALLKTESNFKSNVESNKGAIGLMQLVEKTALEVAPDVGLEISKEEMKQELLDPKININIGTKYLSDLIEKYNCLELALTAYNAGIGNVDKWIEQGILNFDGSNIEKVPFKETNRYVRSILRDYKIYQKIY